jgi:hypothetical protein
MEDGRRLKTLGFWKGKYSSSLELPAPKFPRCQLGF